MALDAERRAALLGAKLGALVAGTGTDVATSRPGTFPGGAALVVGEQAYVLVEERPARALGAALAWARQAGAPTLHVLVDADADDRGAAGVLARQATQFDPRPQVWQVDGRTLVPVESAPLVPAPPLDGRMAAFADVLVAAGADPVVEYGRLVGEVEGLEVARVEVGPDGPVLQIGVGRFDREAHALVSRDRPTDEALADVVALVRRHRRPDAPPHPLRRLAAARWLRSRIVADPGLVGADHLAPVPPVQEPPDLRTAWPAPAAGTDVDGRPLVVVCSTGIDLQVVPAAADARLADGRGARLLIAVPERDDHPVTRALAAMLADPAEVVVVPDERA